MRLSFALLVLPLLALPATGQEASPPKTKPTSCTGLIAFVDAFITDADTRIENIDGGCRISNVLIGPGGPVRYRIADLTLLAPDLFQAIAENRPFADAELTATGVRVSPETGSPLSNYIVEIQQEPLNLHLAYHWDRTAGTVDVTDLSIEGPLWGHAAVSAQFSQFPAVPDQAIDFIATLESVKLDLDSAVMLRTFVAPALLGQFPPELDPRPTIRAEQDRLIALVNGLPDTSLDTPGKAALVAAIEDFPNTGHRLQIAVDTLGGLPLAPVVDQGLAGVLTALPSLKLTASSGPLTR